ncbi:MAG: hypothetical protein ACTSV5_13820 [Promethearchaeota archaeon]
MKKIANIICILIVLIPPTILFSIEAIQMGDPTFLIVSLIVDAVLTAIYYYITNDVESSKWNLRKA